jgi:hypothetical protein
MEPCTDESGSKSSLKHGERCRLRMMEHEVECEPENRESNMEEICFSEFE